MAECAEATQPSVDSLVTSLADRRTSMDSFYEEATSHAGEEATWSVQSPSQSPRSQPGRSPSSMTQVQTFHKHRKHQPLQVVLGLNGLAPQPRPSCQSRVCVCGGGGG